IKILLSDYTEPCILDNLDEEWMDDIADDELGSAQTAINHRDPSAGTGDGAACLRPRIHIIKNLRDGILAALGEALEILEDIRFFWSLIGLGGEVPADKPVGAVVNVFFDGVPSLLVEPVLFLKLLVHQHQVADFICFAQAKSGGIQGLKDALWIIMSLKIQVHDL